MINEAELIIFWFMCGVIAGAIYGSKGRREFVGWMIGFLLGPIGIFLAAIAVRHDQAQPIHLNPVRMSLPKYCPYCSEPNHMEAHHCRHCDSDIRGAFPQKRTVSSMHVGAGD